VTEAFCWVRARSTSSASGRAVTARDISTVNSSAMSHHSEEDRVFSGSGLQHGGGEHGVYVRTRLQQAPPIGQGMEVLVDCGKPSLA
jgi:hypothetical protein